MSLVNVSLKLWSLNMAYMLVCLCWGFYGVMSSAVSLPNHTFTGQALSSKRLTSIVHILSPETDNCPSWISGRERMTVENISWSISTKECCRPRRGSNPRPPGLQSDAHPTEPPRPAGIYVSIFAEKNVSSFCICQNYSHLFSKNNCELDIVLTRLVNILTFNELVKLTMLWTTGPRCFKILNLDYKRDSPQAVRHWMLHLSWMCAGSNQQ